MSPGQRNGAAGWAVLPLRDSACPAAPGTQKDLGKAGCTLHPASGTEDTTERYPRRWDQSSLESAAPSPVTVRMTRDPLGAGPPLSEN